MSTRAFYLRPESVEIPRLVLAAIDAHARRDAPRECCGLLVGRAAGTAAPGAFPNSSSASAPPDGSTGGILVIARAVATRNIASEDTRYLIDPADHFRLLRELREQKAASALPLEIVGAYHSHPDSVPVPSPTDRAEAVPHFLYLIASPGQAGVGSDVRAWWLETTADGAQRNFLEIPLVPIP